MRDWMEPIRYELVGVDLGDPKGDMTILYPLDATDREIDEIIALEYLFRESG